MGRFAIHNRNKYVQAIDYKNGKRYVFSILRDDDADTIEIRTLQKLVELDGESGVLEDTDVGVQDVPDELYERLEMEGYDVEKAYGSVA